MTPGGSTAARQWPATGLVAPLFVPANRPERFAKAAASGTDAVIVDLEDAVPPEQKEAARQNLGALAALPLPVLVRINAAGTPWHHGDLDALRTLGHALVCIPKAEDADVLEAAATALGPEAAILALIETAAGLENIRTVARHPKARQIAFGPADFFLDMEAEPTPELTGLALGQIAVASRAAGLPRPLDGPFFTVGDAAGLARDCAAALSFGAAGKLCIHPSQPADVLLHFGPTADERAWAQRVVEAATDGAARLVDGRMIDAPLLARARAVLARAGTGNREETSSS